MAEPALEFLFHPRAIAVVGASRNPQNQGHQYLQLFQQFGFKGPVYPVNPSSDELLGLKCYPRVRDIPGPLDYVISCVPAAMVVPMLRDCGEKQVKCVHLFTGRLAESGDAERAALQDEVVALARSYGIRLIGPNCMGIYCPKSGLSFRFNFPKEPGPVAFLSQSGGNGADFGYIASRRGVRFSKIVSFGNAADLNESDFLEYFIQDPETKVITAYLEGVREGRRFFQLLQKARRLGKPVVILKGGRGEAGGRAVSSHTGSLAGTRAVWDAVFRQTGVVPVANLHEMVDMALAFLLLRPPQSRRAAVMGGGGGISVQSADDAEAAGLIIPPLKPELKEELQKIAPDTWFMIRNPVDSSVLGDHRTFPQVGILVASMAEVDCIIGNAAEVWALDRPEGGRSIHESVSHLFQIRQEHPDKPMAFVLAPPDAPEDWRRQILLEIQQRVIAAGVPVYPSVARAANALVKLWQYHHSETPYSSEIPYTGGEANP